MDFLHFFGLKEDPFKLTPDPAYFFPSAGHNEGLMLMDYSIDQKEGFLLVIGDPGTGKTTLLKVFLEKWKGQAEIAMILTPRLSPGEFLTAIAEDLHIHLEDKNKNEIIKALRDFVTRKSEEGRRVIIIVDEAQNLPLDTLEELRLLSNLETDKDKLIQIMLIGQPELEAKLTAIKLRQLNQRITTRVHLKHFSAEETREYINYRVIKAGRNNVQIHRKTGRLTHKVTQGIPRLINMLISRALMAAYLEEKNIIAPDHIRHALKSLNHSDLKPGKRFSLVPAAAGALAVAALTAAVYLYLPDKSSETSEVVIQNTAVSEYRHEAKESLPQSNHIPDQTTLNSGSGIRPSADTVMASLQSVNTPDAAAVQHIVIESEPSAPEEIASPAGHAVAEDTHSPVEKGHELAASNDLPDSEAVPPAEQQDADDFKFISITADVAFIRHWPSIDAGKAGWATRGSQLLVIGETLDERDIRWYQIAYQGEKKWISGEVVEAIGWSKSPQ